MCFKRWVWTTIRPTAHCVSASAGSLRRTRSTTPWNRSAVLSANSARCRPHGTQLATPIVGHQTTRKEEFASYD